MTEPTPDPCPFCGGNIIPIVPDDFSMSRCVCFFCQAAGPWYTYTDKPHTAKSGAIAAWNRRTLAKETP